MCMCTMGLLLLFMSSSHVPLTHSAHYCLVGHNLAWGRVCQCGGLGTSSTCVSLQGD